MLRIAIIPLLLLIVVGTKAQTVAFCADYLEHQSSSVDEYTILGVHPIDELLAVSDSNGIKIYRMPEYELTAVFDAPTYANREYHSIDAITWSPNGEFIAASLIYSSTTEFNETFLQAELIVWNFDTQEIVYTFLENHEPYQNRASLLWSPDSLWLAGIIVRSGRLQIWNTLTKELVFEYQEYTEADLIGRLAWSGDTLIFANDADIQQGTSEQVSLEFFHPNPEWTLQRSIEAPFWELKDISYSSQGQLVLIGGALFLFDMRELEFDREIFEPRHQHDLLDWSADGRYLLTVGQYNGLNGFRVYDVENSSNSSMQELPFQARQIDVSPTTQYLYLLSKQNDFVTGNWLNGIYIIDLARNCLRTVIVPST